MVLPFFLYDETAARHALFIFSAAEFLLTRQHRLRGGCAAAVSHRRAATEAFTIMEHFCVDIQS